MKIAKITSLLAAATFITGIGIAQAAEPLQLSSAQMDQVTAGSNNHNRHDNWKDKFNKFKKHRNQTKATASAEAFCDGSSKCATDTKAIAVVGDKFALSESYAVASQRGLRR